MTYANLLTLTFIALVSCAAFESTVNAGEGSELGRAYYFDFEIDRITGIHEDEMEVSIEARTDGRGRTDLRLDRPGVWMITAVHMVPAQESLGADWESLWASLTFELTFETP